MKHTLAIAFPSPGTVDFRELASAGHRKQAAISLDISASADVRSAWVNVAPA